MVIPKYSKANLVLFFKSKDTAGIVQKTLHEAQKGLGAAQVIKVEDDFGCVAHIDRDNICYSMVMDGDKQSELAAILGPQGRRQ